MTRPPSRSPPLDEHTPSSAPAAPEDPGRLSDVRGATLLPSASIFHSLAEGMLLIDSHGVVRDVNAAYEEMSGWKASELIGASPKILAEPLHDPGHLERLLTTEVEIGAPWHGDVHAARKSGETFAAQMSLSALRPHPPFLPGEQDAEQTDLTYYVALLWDITDRKRDEEHIRFQANFDVLTHLPNRYLIGDRMEQAILQASRTGKRLAVLYLGLDRFKQINESHGHSVGDEVLKLTAKRLRKCVRVSDTIGRLSGDEFVVLLTSIGENDAGQIVAEKIAKAFAEPFLTGTLELFALPSFGLAYYPEDGGDVNDLLRNADVAMYHAKTAGSGQIRRYSPDMTRRSQAQLTLETDLRRALGRNEFELFYQPKMGPAGELLGAEALIRWNHSTKGRISPAAFIPLAEESGVIISMGHWILREACAQLLAWDRDGLCLPSISVNVSTKQFRDPQLVEIVAQTLLASGLDPKRLDLEITESVMTGDVEQAVTILQRLKDLGVTLSIDDFGTGYSSLNYLKTFPIDTLKIDQSFVRDLMSSEKDAAIVSTIISLARNLGFSVVAEGVETEDQARILADMTCERFQGYLYSAPLTAADFSASAQRWGAARP
ncbi:MAG: putative bifunctional diguanylate cyclase/phosphodiesterase [Rhodospirillaceae bacterium]